MIKFSKPLLSEIRRCAIQLSPEQNNIQLEDVFKGFQVSLYISETYPSLRRSFRDDDGIDRDGEYYLLVTRL
ncbi:MAG: hypothetical protein IH597_13990 [Bacteroidales bacterium]|nr:hypothetical protein [Bacteroidales bacterium]